MNYYIWKLFSNLRKVCLKLNKAIYDKKKTFFSIIQSRQRTCYLDSISIEKF